MATRAGVSELPLLLPIVCHCAIVCPLLIMTDDVDLIKAVAELRMLPRNIRCVQIDGVEVFQWSFSKKSPSARPELSPMFLVTQLDDDSQPLSFTTLSIRRRQRSAR